MKEYHSETFNDNNAENKINKMASEGWEVLKINENLAGYISVWFVREKAINPQLLSEADDLLKPKNQA